MSSATRSFGWGLLFSAAHLDMSEAAFFAKMAVALVTIDIHALLLTSTPLQLITGH